MTELVDTAATAREGRGVLRALGPGDAPAAIALCDRDPHRHLFVRHRIAETGLRDALLGGPMWGWHVDGELRALLHTGANVVPVEADEEAIAAFAARLVADRRRAASLVGPQASVSDLWERLTPHWGSARSLRLEQPLLLIDHDPLVEPDAGVRPVAIDEVDVLYPAAVAMFREEVGIDPEAGASQAYRARTAQLVARGWAFASFDRDGVTFKAEVGAAHGGVSQLQGVWMRPDLRGRGRSAAALAAVVRLVRASVGPDLTLYVNDYNAPALAAYERVGFRRIGTFASVLL